VVNGDVGWIIGCSSHLDLTIRVRGHDVLLPRWYVAGSAKRRTIEHAYAITGHVAQGMTVDHAFVLGSSDLYREWGYTAMSRGRRTNRLYVVAPDSLDREDFAPQDRLLPEVAKALDERLSVSRAQTAAIDVAGEQWLRRSPTWVLQQRLDALRTTTPSASLAREVREREQLAARLEQVRHQLADADARIAELSERRPARLKRTRRRRHEPIESLHRRSRDGLDRIRRSLLGEIAARDAVIHALRERPADAEVDRERSTIARELGARRAIEQGLAIETPRRIAARP
jgi:hypothetical protein